MAKAKPRKLNIIGGLGTLPGADILFKIFGRIRGRS